MAQAISCDLCQQEAAVMMQSNLTNGDTIGVGESCMITFFASSLTAMLSGAPPEALNSWSPVLVPLGAIIGPQEWDTESDQVKAQTELDAARRLLADPSTYEDGNTEYGIEQALELARKLVREADDQAEADSMAAERPYVAELDK